jgi:hypothetical protein
MVNRLRVILGGALAICHTSAAGTFGDAHRPTGGFGGRRLMMKAGLILIVFMGLCSSRALAKFAMPGEVPVDRLIKNVGAYVKEHPQEAQGYYTLGRVHYLALSMKSKTVRAYEAREAGGLASVPQFFQQPGNQSPSEEELKGHLAAAVENFQKALEIEPKNALFHLGMGSVMEAAVNSGLELGAVPGPKGEKAATGKDAWREAAAAELLRAYDLSIDLDSSQKSLPLHGLEAMISYEAGRRYVALVKEEGAKGAGPEKLAAVEKGLEGLRKLPRGAITPIVFASDGAAHLADLLDARRTVTFDLDGTGRGQAWPWVKRETAILVWDPKASGRIESGRQLFGSVTWWIFWRDGYAALDALDDDRDGQLSGAELKGLAVWVDQNGNGVSDPGEVRSVASLGVERIAARWTERDGASPMNRLGIRMKDGRAAASWDWVAREAGRASR